MTNYGMLCPDSGGYDARLPGYRILGESNGFVQMVLRPRSKMPPSRLVLSLQAGGREIDSSTGATVVRPWPNARTRTELCVFSVRAGNMVIRNDLIKRDDTLVISKGPLDYFRYEIVEDAVRVTFLLKAMALLDQECRILWAHSLDR